jgi:Skp family chaperone for outer membrane proteins
MEKSMQFKDEVNLTMREARAEMLKPLYEKVDEAVMKVCIDGGYDYILDIDNRIYIAINPQNGSDVTEQLKLELDIQ